MRQETVVFGVVDEEEPAQVNESISVDRIKVVTGIEVVGQGLNEALSKDAQSLICVLLEIIAYLSSVLKAALVHAIEEAEAFLASEEEIEALH